MSEATAPSSASWVALLGHPNVGKTTLFNALTGLRQKVGNYPGVTVERREGTLLRHASVRVLDLPGVTSLVPQSPDARIAADVLVDRQKHAPRPERIVLVMDACQLRRGLFLLSQVLECGLPIVVCLNMVDEARREALPVAGETLSEVLGGLPVVETVGTSRVGIDRLALSMAAVAPPAPTGLPLPEIPGILGLPEPSAERWLALRDAVAEAGLEAEEAEARWHWVQGILTRLQMADVAARRNRSDRIDRILLHPLLGPLVFVGIMGCLFQLVFTQAQAPMEWIDQGFTLLSEKTTELLGTGLLGGFVSEGIIAGVGGVLIFLPQILLLFLFLGMLESSGYMTRAAFIMDRPLRTVGLSGKSCIPLLSSFACAVPGILAARTIENRRERLLTILVAPLMTCSARLPVYTILIGTFVDDRTVALGFGLQGLVLLALYLGGLLIALLVAHLVHRWLPRDHAGAGFLELPPYRWPSLGAALQQMAQRALLFLKRAGTVILVMSVLIWALVSFPGGGEAPSGTSEAAWRAEQRAASFAGQLGHLIEPAIAPLGYDWRIGVGLVASFAAREVFVSTMSVVYAVEDGDDQGSLAQAFRSARRDGDGARIYTLATVVSLLVFYAIALQCLSTVAVVLRETGSWRVTLLQLFGFTGLAWLLAWVAYRVMTHLGFG